MSLRAMSVRLSVRPSVLRGKKLLTTVQNINIPSRLISNSSRISDRSGPMFVSGFQRAYFYVSLLPNITELIFGLWPHLYDCYCALDQRSSVFSQ